MQEFAATQNGRRFLNDVNRIAQSLERLAHVAATKPVTVPDILPPYDELVPYDFEAEAIRGCEALDCRHGKATIMAMLFEAYKAGQKAGQ